MVLSRFPASRAPCPREEALCSRRNISQAGVIGLDKDPGWSFLGLLLLTTRRDPRLLRRRAKQARELNVQCVLAITVCSD